MALYKASCACDAVQIEIEFTKNNVGFCHCQTCRKIGASFFLMNAVDETIKINGKENITEYQSSDNASRCFCKKCGTSLYYWHKNTGKISLMAALFDDQTGFNFTDQIFVDRKPHYYTFKDDTVNMTEQDLIAKYKGK